MSNKQNDEICDNIEDTEPLIRRMILRLKWEIRESYTHRVLRLGIEDTIRDFEKELDNNI